MVSYKFFLFYGVLPVNQFYGTIQQFHSRCL